MMKPGEPCQHCTVKGCAIYEERPQTPCRSFECAWLKPDSPIPEDMRPDKSGVIVIMDRYWRGRSIIRAVPAGWKVPEHSLDWLMAFAREKKIPLTFLEFIRAEGSYTGYKSMGYGPPDFVAEVKNGLGPEDIQII